MKGRILLVDDNVDFIDGTKDILEAEGYEVATAACAEDAIELVGQSSYDVILLDVQMPGMSGMESINEIKRRNPSAKIVMVTAHSMRSLIFEALAEGASAVLSKPVEMQRALRMIDDLIPSSKSAKVLVVDDDVSLCDNLSDILDDEGFKVVTALTGRAALDAIEREKFDVALLDMQLPDMDGLQLHRKLKEQHPTLPTIIISGREQEMSTEIKSALHENAHTFLAKPLNLSKLLDLLKPGNGLL